MKTLYLECNMGAAGDMLMAALSELIPQPEQFIMQMNQLGLAGVEIAREKKTLNGITGIRMHVRINGAEEGHEHAHGHEHGGHHHHHHETHGHGGHHHHHHEESHQHGSLAEIEHIISHFPVSEKVKQDARNIYKILADAESKVHGVPMEQIHFHEVGTMDAVADITGVCLLVNMLAPEQVCISPVNVGSGSVACAHGILPVPAPATAEILAGIPIYSNQVEGELCTPTGAAILKYYGGTFAGMPPMKIEKIGYGFGKKEFQAVNCVRAFLGETEEQADHKIIQLACNLDDMTGEQIGYISELLMQKGALDVFTIPVQMKKSRPGQILNCLCKAAQEETFAKLILRHTTTFGLRKTVFERYEMDREFEAVDTPLGPVTIKKGSGYGVEKSKPEYDEIAALAKQHGISIREVLEIAAERIKQQGEDTDGH